jgi:hypothetical protein
MKKYTPTPTEMTNCFVVDSGKLDDGVVFSIQKAMHQKGSRKELMKCALIPVHFHQGAY